MKKTLLFLIMLLSVICFCAVSVGCGGTAAPTNNAEQSGEIDAPDNNDGTENNDDDTDEQTPSDDGGQGNAGSSDTTQQLNALKSSALENLDSSINPLLNKITDDGLKNQITEFYQQSKNSIAAVDSLNTAKATLDQIKSDTTTFVTNMISQQLAKLKTAAIAQLDTLVAAGLNKLSDEELKTELNSFYNTEIAKINAVTDIDQVATVSAEVLSDTTDFAKRLAARQIAALRATVKTYFNDVTQAFSTSPYDYLPAAMKPGFAANLVSAGQVEYDFSDFVNVSDIKYGGFGKQWNMVTDNITQSEYFYKYLNTGNTVISSAITAITDYLDSEYADTIDKTFESNGFSAEISLVNQTFTYSLEYKTGITVPLFGNVSPQIVMVFDTETGEKIFTIKLTEEIRLRCVVTENKYEFGMEYGISIGQRTSYLLIERKDNTVEGHIYEYITLKGKDVMPSCADFYIGSEYVSVVGNKADAMMGSKGYINELYKVNEGKLLGYEVRETLSFPVIGSSDYNTLWFNLSDISGITSIKIGDKTNANESGKSTNDVYLNDSTTLFAPTYNKKALVKTSRKYDIEFRTQYFYGNDAETGKTVEYEVKVPMMFIQEDNDKDTNFTDYPSDIQNDNGITSSVTLNTAVLNKILADYDALIDDFIDNKQMMSSGVIKTFIES